MTLAEFLEARLGDEAARAWAVHDISKCDALLYADLPADAPLPDAMDCECGYPARVLREVAAKRAILAMHEQPVAYKNGPLEDHCICQEEDGVVYGRWPCETLRALAAVWSDHPAYEEAGKP